MTELQLIKLEKTIQSKMVEIQMKKITPKDSGIGSLFNQLKKVDEASYEKKLNEYKKILATI